jgi:hypothetical protein
MDTLIMTKQRVAEMQLHSHRVTTVAASEDSATEARVDEFCHGLEKQLGPACELARRIWLLSELRLPQLRTIAATEAAAADLVIVSVHHAETLPPELRSWIDLWLPHRRKQRSLLLALFDPVSSGVSAALRAHLEEVARRGRMEFLVQSEDVPAVS